MTMHWARCDGARWFLLIIAALVCGGEATPTPAVPSPTVFLLGPNIDPDYMAIDNGVTWIADSNLNNHTVYKIDASQRFVLVPMSSGLSGGQFAVAKDGALWMVAAQPGTLLPVYPPRSVGEGPAQIVRFDADGTMHAFKTEYNHIEAMAMGPDDRPWFGSGDGNGDVAEIAADGTVRRIAVAKGVYICSMTTGPDGALWFFADGQDKLGRITPEGSISYLSVPHDGSPRQILAGPDGDLWFTEPSLNRIAKVTTSGALTEYQIARDADPDSLAFDAKLNLWFAEGRAGRVGRLKPDGTIDEWLVSGPMLYPSAVRVGADGRIWVSIDEALFRDDPDVDYPPSRIVVFKPSD